METFKSSTSGWSHLTPEQKVFYTQIGITAGIHFADGITTALGLQLGLTESNAAVRDLIAQHGIMAIALIKVAITLVQTTVASSFYISREYQDGFKLTTTNRILQLWNTYSVCIPTLNAVEMLQS